MTSYRYQAGAQPVILVDPTFADISSGNPLPVAASLAPGTAALGNVGGQTKTVSVTPTVTAANAYGTNYVVGGKMTFANMFTSKGSGIIQTIRVTCPKVESQGFTMLLFDSDPSATTWTDAAVAAINSADVSKLIAAIPLTSNSQAGTATVAYATGLGLAVAPGITSLYAVLLSNAALTNNFGSTSDIVAKITALQDI